MHTVLANAFHSGGYPDYDVLPGTTYSYRVNAYNSAGISPYSNETSVITPGLPTLTTSAVSAITSTTASSGGNVTSDGGSQIRARGIAWGTSPSPTLSNTTITSDGSGVGSFVSTMNGLTSKTTYYVRSYVTNYVGTAYGNELTFTTF